MEKKRWKTCWCLLYEDRLAYYRRKDSVSPIGELMLQGASVESRVPMYEDRKVVFCNKNFIFFICITYFYEFAVL